MAWDVLKPDPKLEKLMESGVFGSRSAAAYAFNAYNNLGRPESGSLKIAKTGKSYNKWNIDQYLIDCCGVKPENKNKALSLLREASE